MNTATQFDEKQYLKEITISRKNEKIIEAEDLLDRVLYQLTYVIANSPSPELSFTVMAARDVIERTNLTLKQAVDIE